jgi:hypothetical protein
MSSEILNKYKILENELSFKCLNKNLFLKKQKTEQLVKYVKTQLIC